MSSSAAAMDVDAGHSGATTSTEASSIAFLDSVTPSLPSELRPYFPRFKSLRSKKLWYQLTLSLEELIARPEAQEAKLADKRPLLVALYDEFVAGFAAKLSPLRWVGIAVNVARQYQDPKESLAFLESVASKTDTPDAQDAFVFATMEAAHFKLVLGDLEGTKAAMDKCSKVLDTFDSVEHAVHAAFYRVSGDYYKAKAEYANYYKNSLLFLACVNSETDLAANDRSERAHDLSVSALLGDTIYNFGELLLHPILESLQSTPHAWLSDLLFAFNAGDLGRFESLIPQVEKHALLKDNLQFLRQKICLMALIESVFRRSTDDRTLSFETIAQETRLPVDEVEHLVMKALSLNLIRGTLDQYAQLARITWVQPRVLDRRQIEALQERLNQWCERVQSVAEFVKGQTPELFVTA
ncbi:26S proteasome regulatory subunit [Tilletia horrida]|uniref:26S proteasome regulatory subunit n=1 Tax=Tilletia horrida TaxID=155126 RepID=A0AAN6JPG3_9BASI|nr:26S proteasome regulatory subunit [Tilletia horrida]KAK0550730.1 26S proteasome regulatory subunit [Tilletia horrida]KAK0562184.1 26S proteasome regulatory subunit [Tilletia horrida]